MYAYVCGCVCLCVSVLVCVPASWGGPAMPGTFLLHSCTEKAAKVAEKQPKYAGAGGEKRSEKGGEALRRMGQGKLLTMQSTWRRECRRSSRVLRQTETESKDATEVEEDATESAELFSVSTLVWALRRRCAATALLLPALRFCLHTKKVIMSRIVKETKVKHRQRRTERSEH